MPGYIPADRVLFNIMVSGIESSYENCLKNIEGILSGGNVVKYMIVKYLLDSFLIYA